MIFPKLNTLNSKADKDFFKEKCNIFVRLVECYAQKYSFEVKISQIDSNCISVLCEFGVISDASEMRVLNKLLGNTDYSRLCNSAFFVYKHDEVKPYLINLNNTARRELQSKPQNKPSIVDLFCGAGGLSLGFIEAGFKVVLANDIQDVCCETYKYNHPELPSEKVILGDIRQVLDNISLDENVDLVVGGPPCQGFSSANKHHKVIDDPRNLLYKYFIEAISKFAPKFVVMENVRGMLKVADQVISDYKDIAITLNGKKLSYIADYRLFNSQNFGVSQSRERLIYIAIRSDIAEAKKISPSKLFEDINSSCKDQPIRLLREALDFIRPLESPRVKGLTNDDDERTGKKIDVNYFSGCDSPYLTAINCGRSIPFLFNHKARYASDTNYKIFERLEQGDDATDEKIKDIMPYSHRNHCFKDKYYKLIADKPCRTITAHLRMDCLSHIHPFQIRTITPREAARIQSFPDDYLFLGAYLKTYMQVGNAVPPLMAKQIANVIKKYLI